MKTLVLLLVLLGPATSFAHGLLPGDGRLKATLLAASDDLREDDEHEVHVYAAARPAWYGWQILGADLAAPILGGITASIIKGDRESSPGGLIAFACIFSVLYLGGGPGTHLAHHQSGVAVKSFVLRLLAWGVTAGGVALTFGPASHGSADAGLLLTTMGIMGMIGASLVDIAGLAWESAPVASVQPAIKLGPRRASVGLALRF